MKMNIFTAVKYCCILHGRVCVMFLFQVHKMGQSHYGFLKRQAEIIILRGAARVQNAGDLYQFGRDELETTKSLLTKRRHFRYLDEINRNRSRLSKVSSNVIYRRRFQGVEYQNCSMCLCHSTSQWITCKRNSVHHKDKKRKRVILTSYWSAKIRYKRVLFPNFVNVFRHCEPIGLH